MQVCSPPGGKSNASVPTLREKKRGLTTEAIDCKNIRERDCNEEILDEAVEETG